MIHVVCGIWDLCLGSTYHNLALVWPRRKRSSGQGSTHGNHLTPLNLLSWTGHLLAGRTTQNWEAKKYTFVSILSLTTTRIKQGILFIILSLTLSVLGFSYHMSIVLTQVYVTTSPHLLSSKGVGVLPFVPRPDKLPQLLYIYVCLERFDVIHPPIFWSSSGS